MASSNYNSRENKCCLKNLYKSYMDLELESNNECLKKNVSELNIRLQTNHSKIKDLQACIGKYEWKESSVLQLNKCTLMLERLTQKYNDMAGLIKLLIEKSKISNQFKVTDTIKNDVIYILDQLKLAKTELKEAKINKDQKAKTNLQLKKNLRQIIKKKDNSSKIILLKRNNAALIKCIKTLRNELPKNNKSGKMNKLDYINSTNLKETKLSNLTKKSVRKDHKNISLLEKMTKLAKQGQWAKLKSANRA